MLERRIDPFERSKTHAVNSARLQLQFILDNRHHLQKVDRTGRKLQAAEEFQERMNRGEQLTPAQFAYIDGIYEATWKGLNLPSVGAHIDRKRKGLRYG